MSDSMLTHKALAAMLGVSETTVKSYRRKFPGCIPVFSDGKPIRFTQEAAAVAVRIRDLFTSGMSVKEVRARLSGEFTWIPADAPARPEREVSDKAAPELTVGVSNMAKSMVAMTQQQSAMMKRMQTIENQLAELGLKGTDMEAMRKSGVEVSQEKEERLEQRLTHLDAITQGLADTVSSLAGELSRFLGTRDKAAEEWRKSGGLSGSGYSADQQAVSVGGASSESPHSTAQVISLRPNTSPKKFSESVPHENRTPTEPPRHFFSLPLVVRTAQGQCVSADGRMRSRFCLNDLKAMLIYGFTPPSHYVLQWEPHGQGWWLALDQPQQENSRALQLLLMEVPGRPEGNVVEILQLQEDGQPVHPTAIARILESFNG